MSNPTIANRIRCWREVAQITRAELASRVGVSGAAVSQWESGESNPTAERLERVAESLGVSMAEFYGPLPAKSAA